MSAVLELVAALLNLVDESQVAEDDAWTVCAGFVVRMWHDVCAVTS